METPIKRKAGRPKGSLNKIALNRTRFIQDRITEDMLGSMIDRLYEDYHKDDTSIKDRVAIYKEFTMHNTVKPTNELIEDLEKITSGSDHTKALELLKQRIALEKH